MSNPKQLGTLSSPMNNIKNDLSADGDERRGCHENYGILFSIARSLSRLIMCRFSGPNVPHLMEHTASDAK